MGEEGEEVKYRLCACLVGGTLGKQEDEMLLPRLPGGVDKAMPGYLHVHKRAKPVQDLFKRRGQVMKINRRRENKHIGIKYFYAQRFPLISFYGTALYEVASETTSAVCHIAPVCKNFMTVSLSMHRSTEKFTQHL